MSMQIWTRETKNRRCQIHISIFAGRIAGTTNSALAISLLPPAVELLICGFFHRIKMIIKYKFPGFLKI